MSSNYRIREVAMEDAEAVLQLQASVIAEENYLITVKEEFEVTAEQQRQWIQKLLKSDRETLLVAEINHHLIGWAVLQVQHRKRLSHVGSVGMMIEKSYRNKGIGRKLLSELLRWAEENPFIEKVTLGVFSTNINAISLYKKLGFKEEGRKIREIKLADGEYADDILMYKFVSDQPGT
ncbi:GNAT family N-acetyltransferase [Bacillus lacus]|uniref:GNAT family N-acetyltransferase n=1 Tax=Metabacillus lacus TaxID=1983721 RepID=A0A7X2J2J7_9BACI|nr:GNAT family N-acetyltransferase [Metabacillus lacus]MRX73932.1 GNAT family N-acetyltransferase [Metabacillus lacus]